jgi:hypothetical protein
MNETRILITLLWMYIPRNWEFSSALSKLRNFGGGVLNPLPVPVTQLIVLAADGSDRTIAKEAAGSKMCEVDVKINTAE